MDDEFWTDMIAKKNSVKSARYYYLCYQIKTNDCIEHPVPLFREGDKVYDLFESGCPFNFNQFRKNGK